MQCACATYLLNAVLEPPHLDDRFPLFGHEFIFWTSRLVGNQQVCR